MVLFAFKKVDSAIINTNVIFYIKFFKEKKNNFEIHLDNKITVLFISKKKSNWKLEINYISLMSLINKLFFRNLIG